MSPEGIPASVGKTLPGAVVPLTGVFCSSGADVFVVDVFDEVVHVAHVLLAAIPAAHCDLFCVVEVVVAGAAGGARDGAGGVGGDVGEGVVVGERGVVVREEGGVGVVGEGGGCGAFGGGARGGGGGGGIHVGDGGEGGWRGHGGWWWVMWEVRLGWLWEDAFTGCWVPTSVGGN